MDNSAIKACAAAIFLAAGQASAGAIELQDYETGRPVAGTTLAIEWKGGAAEEMVTLEKKVVVANKGTKDLSVGVKKVEYGALQADVQHSICYAGVCFLPEVYVSPLFQVVPAGKTDKDLETAFKGSYSFAPPAHRGAVDRVAYVFFDEHNPSDSAVVYVTYSTLSLGNAAIRRGGGPSVRLRAREVSRGRTGFTFSGRTLSGRLPGR